MTCSCFESGIGSPRGFTLIELVIAIAIVSILAGIAVPTMSDYLRRGRLIDAVARLSDHRVRMEQFFLDNATRWADALRNADADVAMVERDGEHGGAFWGEELPLMVAWAFGS